MRASSIQNRNIGFQKRTKAAAYPLAVWIKRPQHRSINDITFKESCFRHAAASVLDVLQQQAQQRCCKQPNRQSRCHKRGNA